LGEHFVNSSIIRIAEMDCGEYASICKKFNIREYPTLVLYEGGNKIEKYSGERTLPALIDFIELFFKAESLEKHEEV